MVFPVKLLGGPMKTLILATVLMSSSAFATTLKIPLFIDDGGKLVPVSQLNETYKLKGNDKLQDTLVITNTKQSITEAMNAYSEVSTKVDVLAEKVKKEFFVAGDSPGGFKVGNIQTCYTGSPDEAVEIASYMTDSIYSDQLGIFGYKYKNQTTFLDGLEPDTLAEFLNEQSPTWKNWKSTNDDILVLSHESDSGDDVNEGIITKCK